MAVIVDQAGHFLADVDLSPLEDRATLEIEHVLRGKGQLLRYYFVQSGRVVAVVLPGLELKGHLFTRWENGKRMWRIRMLPPALDAGGREGEHALDSPEPVTIPHAATAVLPATGPALTGAQAFHGRGAGRD